MVLITSKELPGLPADLFIGTKNCGRHAEESILQLNDQEQERVRLMKGEQSRNQFISSRMLLRGMMEQLGYEKGSWKLRHHDNGQPWIELLGDSAVNQLYVGIAHTRSRVLVGVSKERALGVDLEKMGRTVPEQLKKRILSVENDYFEKTLNVLKLWTIKEAILKLSGEGLRLGMNRVTITGSAGSSFTGYFKNRLQEIMPFSVTCSEVKKHWIAVATYA